MDLFRRLAIASTAATLLLVTIGGFVRATKSGLGCGTDWPECSGKLVPTLQNRAELIEYSHRFAAGVLVVLLAALAVVAVRQRRTISRVLWASIAAFGVVLLQAGLGAVVVKLELEAESVVLHLATAMTLLALLVYVICADLSEAEARDVATDRDVSRRAFFAAALVLVVLLVGSYVTGRDAGYVFDDWPLMNGRLVPDLSIAPYAIHFVHRALAGIVAISVVALMFPVMRRKDGPRAHARLAHSAVGLYMVQIVLGALNVWTGLNAALVTAHLLAASLIWATLVSLSVIAHPAAQGSAVEPRLRPHRAAVEPGRS